MPQSQLAARRGESRFAERENQPGLLRHGDKRPRGDEPLLGVLPADQSFETDDPPGDHADDRLVVEKQLSSLERLSQIALSGEPLDREGVHLRRAELKVAAAESFARYMAVSAARSRLWGSSPSSGKLAMPMLAVTWIDRPSTSIGRATASKSF